MSAMTKVVLDASAFLALLNQEPGYQQVEKNLQHAIMSSVNVSEVVAIYSKIGATNTEIKTLVHDLIYTIIPFDTEQAFLAGFMRKTTLDLGLSFGDRACLSLAQKEKIPVLTADKIWGKLKLDIEIKIIR